MTSFNLIERDGCPLCSFHDASVFIALALPDLLGLLYHVDQQLENRLSLKPHLDAVDNDI
jgi:hypothetical protein